MNTSFLDPIRRLRRHLRQRAEHRAARRAMLGRVDGLVERLRALKREHGNRPLVGILLTEHIGDIVACEPVVAHLRGLHPDAVLVWAVRRPFRDLVAHHPGIDALLEVDSLSEIVPLVRSGVLDVVADLHIHGKPTGFGKERHLKRWGDLSIGLENYYSHGPLFKVCATGAGLRPELVGPKLYLPPAVVPAVDALGLPERFIVAHPRSNERARNWNDASWAPLARSLMADGTHRVVEIGTTATFAGQVPGTVDLCGRLSIVETGEVIRRAALFIGIDSGPAHFANAFEVPSVILLGAYRQFATYMPYTGFLRDNAARMVIQWPKPSSEIPVEVVLEKATALLNAR